MARKELSLSHTPFIPLRYLRDVRGLIAVALALPLLVSCAPSRAPLLVHGDDLTMQQAMDVARTADVSKVKDVDVEDASEARSQALVAIRREGGEEAGRLADLLTRDFPENTRSVPVLVEDATVDGVPAWIVVEAWGGRTGRLTHRRVWVFSRDNGRLLRSASFR